MVAQGIQAHTSGSGPTRANTLPSISKLIHRESRAWMEMISRMAHSQWEVFARRESENILLEGGFFL